MLINKVISENIKYLNELQAQVGPETNVHADFNIKKNKKQFKPYKPYKAKIRYDLKEMSFDNMQEANLPDHVIQAYAYMIKHGKGRLAGFTVGQRAMMLKSIGMNHVDVYSPLPNPLEDVSIDEAEKIIRSAQDHLNEMYVSDRAPMHYYDVGKTQPNTQFGKSEYKSIDKKTFPEMVPELVNQFHNAKDSRPYILGSPGVGKTTLVGTVAKSMKKECIAFDATAMAIADVVGLPSIEYIEKIGLNELGEMVSNTYKATTFLANELFPRTPGIGGIIFIDEIAAIDKSIMPCLLQLVQFNKVANVIIPDSYQVWGASNYRSDYAGGKINLDITQAANLRARFNLYELVADIKTTKEHWYDKHGAKQVDEDAWDHGDDEQKRLKDGKTLWHREIMEFLESKGNEQYLDTQYTDEDSQPEYKKIDDADIQSSVRGWTRAVDQLKKTEDHYAGVGKLPEHTVERIIRSHVGSSASLAFHEFHKMKQFLPTPEEIMHNPKEAKLPPLINMTLPSDEEGQSKQGFSPNSGKQPYIAAKSVEDFKGVVNNVDNIKYKDDLIMHLGSKVAGYLRGSLTFKDAAKDGVLYDKILEYCSKMGNAADAFAIYVAALEPFSRKFQENQKNLASSQQEEPEDDFDIYAASHEDTQSRYLEMQRKRNANYYQNLDKRIVMEYAKMKKIYKATFDPDFVKSSYILSDIEKRMQSGEIQEDGETTKEESYSVVKESVVNAIKSKNKVDMKDLLVLWENSINNM